MPQLVCGEQTVNVNDNGYLINTDDWNENVAHALAAREDVSKLTPEMMEVLKFMRSYYKNYQSFPILGSVCRNVHQPGECVNEEFVDPLKAWKIAGLPEPVDEVVSYLKRPTG